MNRETARDDNGGVLGPIRNTPSPLRRLRRARTVTAALPGLDLQIRSLPNGQRSITLPAELMEFFVADMEHRLAEWKEQTRKARVEEQQREAVLRVQTGEARREWDATADQWTAQYLKLREEGKGYRESLRLIRGPKTDRRESPQICEIELGIREGLARRREQRHADVISLARDGMPRQAIADKLRLHHTTVSQILRGAGLTMPDQRRTAKIA